MGWIVGRGTEGIRRETEAERKLNLINFHIEILGI
jgi:hypothetical protein